MKPTDAVIIAIPDNHHVRAAMLFFTLQAGLDGYLEKHLSVSIPEGRLLADAAK